MLSLALEKQNVLLLQNMMWQKVGGMFAKIKLDGGSIMAVMGSTSERCTSVRYQTLGLNNKDETGRVTCMRRKSRCSVSV